MVKFHVVGSKDVGKTSLCIKLVNILKRYGYKVAFVKHTSLSATLHTETTDTGRVFRLGVPVFLYDDVGNLDMLLNFDNKDKIFNFIEEVVFDIADIVVVEGGKNLPGIKVYVGDLQESFGISGIVAYYVLNNKANVKNPNKNIKVFSEGQEEDLVKFLMENYLIKMLKSNNMLLSIDNKRICLKGFVEDFIRNTVNGFLSSLKGWDPDYKVVKLFIKKVLRGDRDAK